MPTEEVAWSRNIGGGRGNGEGSNGQGAGEVGSRGGRGDGEGSAQPGSKSYGGGQEVQTSMYKRSSSQQVP